MHKRVTFVTFFLFQRHDIAAPVIIPPVAPREDIFLQRKAHLSEQCVRIRTSYESHQAKIDVDGQLNIDNNHRLVYCAVQKVGCTFWHRVFQVLGNSKNVTNPFKIKTKDAYGGFLTGKDVPFEQLHKMLNSYRKFMFAREPYGRLLSFYVDKLYAPNSLFWKIIGKKAVVRYRDNPTDKSKLCGHDVTFEETVRYFLDADRDQTAMDSHFLPIFQQCRPCDIDYDFIGKLETFEDDTFYLLNKLDLKSHIEFDNFENESELDAINETVAWAYSMSKRLDTCITKRDALFRAYRKLQIRGVLSTKIAFPLQEGTDITREECLALFRDVHMRSGSPDERRANRKEALIEAYRTIQPDLFQRLQEVLSIDATLFGYETFPSSLRNVTDQSSSDFLYFKLTAD